MNRLALYLGTHLVLGFVLASVAALNPAPVDAVLCKKHGPTSAKCETAKDDAIEICMEVVK